MENNLLLKTPSRVAARMGLALVLLVSLNAAGQGGGLSQEAIGDFCQRATPALGVVKYSADITDENSGESSQRDSTALGLVVDPSGLVMAPGHIQRKDIRPFNISVTFGSGTAEKKYEAVLLSKPDEINVVFLRLKSETPLSLPAVRFSSENALKIGSPVIVAGMMGEAFDYAPSAIEARVGAVLDKPRLTYCLDDAIRFGYAGGPVADASGRIVGVAGYDLSRQEGGELYVRSGHPMIFQADLFLKYISNPPGEKAEVSETAGEAWLGVLTQPLTEDFLRYWNPPRDHGVLVSTVVEGSPAAAAGLRAGDIISDFDGTPIHTRVDQDVMGFTKLIRDTGTGKEVGMTVLRAGETLEIKAVLGTRPRSAQEAEEYTEPHFGLTVREITTDLRIRINLPEDVQGVIVRKVESGSVAQIGKMRPGVIVLGIDNQQTRSIAEFKAAVEAAAAQRPREVSVFARVGAATGFFRLEPRWNDNK